nr:Ribosomal RNA methyltransferase (FmrO) [uncultured bacterium]
MVKTKKQKMAYKKSKLKKRGKVAPHIKRMTKSKAPRPDRFDHTKPLPKVAIPATITADILDKKDLLVAPDFANHIILRYLRKNPALIEKLHEPHVLRSAEYEKMKKWVRQELRVLVGMFVFDSGLKGLATADTEKILTAHRSTIERQMHYPGLYDDLFGSKKPEVILDLCAGLNPCAYEYLGCTPVYYAIDVSPQLMAFVQQFFDDHAIVGKAWAEDITTMKEFPDADTILIFKGMDVLERVKYGYGEQLLNVFLERRIIVSFATATISGGREISTTKRTWVERWAANNNKSVRIHDIPGERFYIIE